MDGLNREIQKSQGGRFVLYEELTQYSVKKGDKPEYKKKDGRYLKSADGKKIPLKKTKLTVGKVGTPQREVLFVGGKRRRTSQGFVMRSRRELVDSFAVRVLEPQYKKELKFKHQMFLQGPTILDTLRPLKLPFSTQQMRRNKWIGVATEIELRVTHGQETLVEPVVTFAYTEVLSDFALEVGKAIRFKLADHGYRFTSLVTLYELVEENPDYEDRILFVGRKPKKHVEKLAPIFPEHEGMDTVNRKDKRAPKVFIRLNITPY